MSNGAGDEADSRRAALNGMTPVIYDELRRLAISCLHREREGHTLEPTELVHEAYLRLRAQKSIDWDNRAQVLGIAARMMRRVLMDYWSERHAQKRVEGGRRITLGDSCRITRGPSVDFIDLERALVALEALDMQQAQIVELRFFGGLTIDEAAEALDLSAATVEREWSTARLWLARRLEGQAQP